MNIGIIGLGRMGSGIAQRLLENKFIVFGFDPDQSMCELSRQIGVTLVSSAAQLLEYSTVIFLLVPAGTVVDSILDQLQPHINENIVIIDAGNSNYNDSIRRAYNVSVKKGIFLDCGTSGGVQGAHLGFCLMIGGDITAYNKIIHVFQAIAAPNAYAHVGPSGAGHYIKMIHNGIEYALLQAYAEGFQLLKEGSFKDKNLDLQAIAQLWNHGSVIRSWILQLLQNVLQQQERNLTTISGRVAESGTGRWTVQEAHDNNIPIRLIEDALAIRFESQTTDGNYATKLVALLRNQFGGHTVSKKVEQA